MPGAVDDSTINIVVVIIIIIIIISDTSALEVLPFHGIALYKSSFTYLLTLLTFNNSRTRWQ